MEPIIIIVLVVLVVLVLLGRRGSLSGLVVNGIIGVVLLFLTNLFLADDLPINLLTIISAPSAGGRMAGHPGTSLLGHRVLS